MANKQSLSSKIKTFLIGLLFLTGCQGVEEPSSPSSVTPIIKSTYLKDIYKDYFDIGAAVYADSIRKGKYDDLMDHFSVVTCENEMKWGRLEAEKGKFTYSDADTIVSYAKEQGKKVRGHTLLWYKSLPNWLKEVCVDKETALEAIDDHIEETMTHFKGDIYCYDVVNEALKDGITSEDLTNDNVYRTGSSISGDNTFDFYRILGKQYLLEAFKKAGEMREKLGLNDLKLYYNDYSLNNPNKREAAVKLVTYLQSNGAPLDGIGMQAHYRLSDYEADKEGFLKNFEDSLKAFLHLGIDVQITELDIRVYKNSSDPSQFDSLPYDVEVRQAEMFSKIYEICREYSLPYESGAGVVNDVSTWGVADDHNAMNTSSHKEFPLLFNQEHQPKKAYYEIVDFK